MKIHKYLLNIKGTQVVELPKFATFLSMQMQGSHIAIWAIVDPDKQMIPHKFILKATGEECDDINSGGHVYLGTIQDIGFVWHIFLYPDRHECMRTWNSTSGQKWGWDG